MKDYELIKEAAKSSRFGSLAGLERESNMKARTLSKYILTCLNRIKTLNKILTKIGIEIVITETVIINNKKM